jgi:chaperonin GroEL
MPDKPPELLDDGGTIAKRIINLPQQDLDPGAMLMRNALWKLREDVGDGAATAAVLCQAVFEGGRRYAAAGGDMMRFRVGLERGMRLVDDALAKMAFPIESEDAIARVAEGICHEGPLAKMFGEVFGIIGEFGHLEIRGGKRRGLDREYVEGAYWNSGWLSPRMITDVASGEAHIHNTAILITNLEIKEGHVPGLAAVMDMVFRKGAKSLVVVAKELSAQALALILLNQGEDKLSVLGVKTPKYSRERTGLEDIRVLTGGRLFLNETGESLAKAQWEDLGQARRVWATRHHFGVVGGQGDVDMLRGHIDQLRDLFSGSPDPDVRRLTRERIGKLTGGSAIMWVGGQTTEDLEARKEMAQRLSNALRVAMRDGVVPGGGSAFLACRDLLSDLPEDEDEDERVAFRVLGEALEAPARVIAANAGYDPSKALARVHGAGPGIGFDVRTGEATDMRSAGILDVVTVAQGALRTAVRTAAVALTTEVLVLRSRPERIIEM